MFRRLSVVALLVGAFALLMCDPAGKLGSGVDISPPNQASQVASLDASLVALTATVTTNTTNLATLDGSVVGNTSSIAALEASVATHTTQINGLDASVLSLDATVVANTASIATHTTQINGIDAAVILLQASTKKCTTYLSGSTNYVVEADVHFVTATGYGGSGGGGYGGNSTTSGNGGGGSGGGSGGSGVVVITTDIPVTPGETCVETVGIGGTGGIRATATDATPGGDTMMVCSGINRGVWPGGEGGGHGLDTAASGTTGASGAHGTGLTYYARGVDGGASAVGASQFAGTGVGGWGGISGGNGGAGGATPGNGTALVTTSVGYVPWFYAGNSDAGIPFYTYTLAVGGDAGAANCGGGGGAGGAGGSLWPIVPNDAGFVQVQAMGGTAFGSPGVCVAAANDGGAGNAACGGLSSAPCTTNSGFGGGGGSGAGGAKTGGGVAGSGAYGGGGDSGKLTICRTTAYSVLPLGFLLALFRRKRPANDTELADFRSKAA